MHSGVLALLQLAPNTALLYLQHGDIHQFPLSAHPEVGSKSYHTWVTNVSAVFTLKEKSKEPINYSPCPIIAHAYCSF